ncbi:MAG: PQQ-binding-like beta-propeller repeat protein, partial [Planctomycetaceae bacterium]|nr:PQQ-binding-like beta-propeller repeat protein [Planctomycetaceae bacterium]
PTEWGKDRNIRWRTELNGTGNSSPIVIEGRVFVTVARDEGAKRNLICFDRQTGKELWTRTVEWTKNEVTHQTNKWCGSTPAATKDHVVVWHGSAGLYCYTLDGEELWSTDLGKFEHMWGYGSSPVIHEGMVYLQCGPGVNTFMAGIGLADGELKWKTEEPGGVDEGSPRMVGSWSTPLVVDVDGQQQLVSSLPTRVVSYDLQTGEILWTVDGLTSVRGDLVYSSMVVAGDVGVAMGGFRGPVLGFRLGGRGDVTGQNRLWHEIEGQPVRIGSGVVVDGTLYMANAGPGTAQAIDINTGEVLWQDRLRGNHWGSIVMADGLLYATDQKSNTHVFRPSREKFDVVQVNSLNEPSNSTPAISDNEIFLRTAEALYCVSTAE